MKKLLSCVLLCSVLTSTLPVWADDSIQTIPPGEDKISPLKKGEVAPYDGQLFDNYTALRWGNWLLQYKLRLRIDVEYQKKLWDADVELWKKKYEISETKYTVVTADYQKKVAALETQVEKYRAEVESPAWYRSPITGFVLGVVVTGACVGVGAYVYSAGR